MLEMMGMRGGDIDKVHFRVLHQFPVGAIGLRNTVFRSEGLRLFQTSGCHCVAFTILRFPRQCPGHLYGYVACANYSQFHISLRFFSANIHNFGCKPDIKNSPLAADIALPGKCFGNQEKALYSRQ